MIADGWLQQEVDEVDGSFDFNVGMERVSSAPPRL